MADAPIGSGTILAGRFRLEDLLAETDGARFWRATDQTLARNVAVHVLPDDDPRADSLLVAARTSALVTDGHFLRVLDAASEDGVVYVVNEWGSGVSLDRLLTEGPLSPRRAAWVVKEVAEAISTAHRNGVAHGRLIPEMVMITEAGSVKLIGFVVEAVLRGREHHRVTGGDSVSAHEGDVLNLAALLYAALVGKWAGTEGSSLPTAPAEHGRPLRPRRVRAGVPRPLDAICDRVLNAEAHAHAMPIETAHEIYAALSDFIGDPGTAAAGFEHTGSLPAATDDARPAVLDDGEATGEMSEAELDDTQVHHARPYVAAAALDTGELEATGAMPVPEAVGQHRPEPDEQADPDATQIGTPVFFDENAGVGWMTSTDSRGLRQDERDEPPTRRTPTPPPVLPEPEERPLFAEGPSAAAAAAAASRSHGGHAGGDTGTGRSGYSDDSDSFVGGFTGSSTGHGNGSNGNGGRTDRQHTGSVPVRWGPDDEPDPGDWDSGYVGNWSNDDGSGKSWLKLAAVIAGVVVLVLAVILAFNLGRKGPETPGASETPSSGPSSATPSTSTEVKISGVTDFDPQGDPPEENPDLAPLAIDGKQATAWQTLTYRGNPKLGGLKSGVGLLVDLGKPTSVSKVRLSLLGDGTSLDLLAAPDAKAAPSSTDGLDKVASAQDAGTKVDLTLDKPVRTRWFVVWLTSLPATPGGFKGQVAEISVRS